MYIIQPSNNALRLEVEQHDGDNLKITAHFGSGDVTVAIVPTAEFRSALHGSNKVYDLKQPCILKRIYTRPRRSFPLSILKHYTQVWLFFEPSGHGDLVVVRLADLRAALKLCSATSLE